MNQRSSHFTLGNSSAAYGSVYSKDFLPKQPSSKQVNPTVRSSSVANPQSKSYFSTTNKQLMRDWSDKSAPSALDPNKLKELRGHHFHLGNYNPGELNTSNKIFFDQKHISNDANKNQEESKIKMRAHHHDFKEQNRTNFQSSYASQFNANKQGNNNRQSQVKQELGNAIVLGNHNVPMITTSKLNYTQKQQIPSNIVKNSALQQTSALVLGGQGPSCNQTMQTVNQQFYNEKPIVKNQLPQATMKELRSTHFNLGNMKQSFDTQSKHYQTFNSKSPQQRAKEIPNYQAGTWTNKQAKFNAVTTNKRQLPQRSVQPYVKHGPPTRGGFQLGSGATHYETQNQKNFLAKTNDNYKLYKGAKGDNVEIGYSKGNYQTEHKSNFKTRDHREGKFQIDVKAKNTQDHFTIGGQSNQALITTYQDQHRKDLQNTNKMFHKARA